MVDTRDQSLSILYVDDEPGLLEIARVYLERTGNFTITTAEGAVRAIEILSDRHFDVIISDYQMPGMDGIAFLKYLRSRKDTTPFIIFTGKGREEVVIQALNEGADFYLQKGGNPKAQFAELANKVRYAVNRRRSEISLAESERQYNLLFEHINAGFALHDIILDENGIPCDYRFININPAFEEITGLSRENIIGKTVLEILPGTEEDWILKYGDVALHGKAKHFQNYSSELGKFFDVLAYSPEKGKFAVSIQDITERKSAEMELFRKNEELSAAEEELRSQLEETIKIRDLLTESNEYLANLITHANAPIIVWDRDLRITKFNDAFGRLTGIPPKEAIGLKLKVLFPEESQEESMGLIRRAMAGEMWDVVEIPIHHRTGEVRTVLWNSANIRGSDGKTTIATIAQGQDITDRINAEEALKRSNERLKSVINSIESFIYIADMETYELLFLNEYGRNAWGDVEGTICWKSLQNGQNGPCSFCTNDKLLNKDGDPAGVYVWQFQNTVNGHWYECRDMAIPWIDGRIVRMEIATDITERKAAEQILLQKNEELHSAYEQLTESEEELKGNIEELRRQEQIIRESESRLRYLLGFYEMAHLPEKELLAYALEGAGVITGSPLGYLAFLNDDESELSMYAWSKTAMKECSMRDKPIVYRVEKTGLWGEAVRQRCPVITNNYAAPNPQKKGYPKGHPQIIRHMNVPILDGDHIVIVAGVANKPLDYTDNDTRQLTLLMQGLWQVLKRRRIEEEFRSQQEQLSEITEMVPGVVFQFYSQQDGEKGVYYISSRAEEVFGISNSPEGFFERFTEQVDPRDRDAFLQSIEEVAKSGQPWHYEGRFIRPSGEEIWFQGMSRPIQRGSEIVFNGILLDITGQKTIEEALHERIKELFCLYRISDVIEGSDKSFNEVIQQIAGIIPGGFRRPEKTTASISINKKEYATPGYQRTPWSIHVDILIHQEPTGSITICLMENDQILPEEEKLVESIALQIGRYIERIRSVDELYQKNVELSDARESLHTANKKLQLLSSITRHDILNKIMALEGFLNLAEEMCVDSKQSEYLNEVRNIIGAIHGQIEFTRMYEDVGVKQPLWQPLRNVFGTLCTEQVQVHDNCKEISICADPMLEKVFYNLYDNTIRYANSASRIALSCEEREGKLAIIWEDNGPGVPDDQKEQIFVRGFGKNTGFGLFLAREILGITGITILENGVCGRGARFEILVPEERWKRESL